MRARMGMETEIEKGLRRSSAQMFGLKRRVPGLRF